MPILYSPTPSHIKFINKNIALAEVKSNLPSGSSHDRNTLGVFKIPLMGFIIAIEVIEIEKMLRFFPLIHIMNPFIAICFAGPMAIDIAFVCLRALMATACLFSAADNVEPSFDFNVLFCSISFSIDRTNLMSQGAGFLCNCAYPGSFSFRFRLTDQRLRNWREKHNGRRRGVQELGDQREGARKLILAP